MWRAIFICFILACAAVGSAVTVDIFADRDNTLIEDPTGSLSNGAGDNIVVGRTNVITSGRLNRGVVHFNVDAGVPNGATITAAVLKLEVLNTAAGPQTVTVHRLNANWGEGSSNTSTGGGAPSTTGDATWIHRLYTSSSWTTPGGDFSPTISASQSVAGISTIPQWSSAQLTADVQNMKSSPANNFGWLLKGNESVLQTTKQFGSRTHPTITKPTLTVTYTGSSSAEDWMLFH
jgi:hypothetical protein